MSFVSKEIRRFGYIVLNGARVLAAQYHFECGSASDLPTQTQFQNDKNVFLFMGSTAHTIDTDKKYELDSAGNWVEQSQPWQPLADYSVLANKPQINGHTLSGDQSGADLGLQNILSFDSTPTQGSANPVTSGGIRTDQKRQDALQIEDRAALVELADNGAKNLFDISVLKSSGNLFSGSYTNNGVTYTLNSDGTISLSGTARQNSTCSFTLFNSNSPYLAKFAGKELSGGLSDKVYLAVEMSTSPYTQLAVSQGEASTIAAPDNTKQYLFYARVKSGENVDGKVISPMICTKAALKISKTYQPYRPSWQEMYYRVSTLDGITPKVVYTNALLVSTGTTMAATGLEYTIAGTSTATYRLTAIGSYNGSQPDELRLVNKVTGSLYGIATRSDVGTNASIIVSGCVATGSNITVEVQAKYVSAGNNYIRLIVEKIPT